MRKLLLGFVLVLVFTTAYYLHSHRAHRTLDVAYAASRELTLWSSSAQIREEVATVSYGERLEVLGRYSDQVEVRTKAGVTGWTTLANLLSADLWQKAGELNKVTAALPVEAHGRTRVLSNLHFDPSRDSPRIRQLAKAVPVELFERKAVEVPTQPRAASDTEENSDEPQEAKKEDWWLVRAQAPGENALSGWVLGRFVDLDVPAPLPDYASAAGMRIIAWFELNRVADSSGAAKPQYLVVGVRGPEGQACDFTLLRVFTWSKARQRYETAFVESDVCGKLPMKLTRAEKPGGEATFEFEDWSKGISLERTYHIRDNVVRRVKVSGGTSALEKRTRG